MDKQRQEAMAKAYSFVVYQESEQADQNTEENKFDAMWQSIYDVCKLVKFQIIDDISQEEFEEAFNNNEDKMFIISIGYENYINRLLENGYSRQDYGYYAILTKDSEQKNNGG